MKKLIACLFACLLIFVSMAACEDQGVSLFLPYYGATLSVPGVYATLTTTSGLLYTGPGTDYYAINPFEVTNASAHCLSLAYDRYGAAWVLVEVDNYGMPWRGYVRLSEFSASSQKFLTANLPCESSYDDLTPMMIAQFYYSCDGLLGPGEDYPMLFPVESAWGEGTLIMTSGNWALMELSDYTLQQIGVNDAKCRLWFDMSNLFY